MTKNEQKKILSRALQIAVAKDGRTPYAIANELKIDKAGFYRFMTGEFFPSTSAFLRIRTWMNGVGVDVEGLLHD